MQAFTILLSVISFFAQNKDAIKTMILDMEALLPNSNGHDKAAQVKNYIAASLGIEAQIETVWPLLAPIFNAFVGTVKSPAVA